jgi:hypothetical protein
MLDTDFLSVFELSELMRSAGRGNSPVAKGVEGYRFLAADISNDAVGGIKSAKLVSSRLWYTITPD